MADNDIKVERDNNGNIIIGNNNTINAPQHQTPKTLTPTLGSHTNFIGREEDLKVLNNKLNSDSNRLLLLNGIGGIGKSSLAAYYLHRHRDSYDYYGFVEVSGGVEEGFVSALQSSLDLSKDKTIEEGFKEALIKLHSLEGKKLLIIDDIKHPKACAKSIEHIQSLGSSGFNLLFTSREEIEDMPYHYLDTLSQHDAQKLFTQYYPTDELDKVERILTYLDNHTLFVEMSAKTLSKRKDTMDLESMVAKFQSGAFASIKRDRKESFATLLGNLFANDELLNDEQILTLLQKLTLLPSIEIPFDTLQRFLACEDRELLQDLLLELTQSGWLISSNAHYKVHQIIQEYIQSHHTPSYPTLEPMLEYANTLIENSANAQTAIDVKEDLVYLDSMQKSMERLGIENKSVATFNNDLGNIYYHLGDYSKALTLLEKALSIQEQHLGKEHPDTATSYNNIGGVYNLLGEYQKALEYHQKALEIREKVYGLEHPNTATSYNNIGSLYYSLGDYPKALEEYQKALKIKEIVYGLENPDTAQSYHNIAHFYFGLEEYQKAYEYIEKAVKIREKIFPSNHPSLKDSQLGLELIQAML
jgi:tetratricopeptide (TPR) repeat protein